MFSPAFFVSSSFLPAFFKAFFTPLFSCIYNLLTVPRGCFTPIGVIHLSLLASLALLSLSFLFLLSFSPLFSFFPPSLPFLTLSLCRFLVRRPPPCRTASDGPAPYNLRFLVKVKGCAFKFKVKVHFNVCLFFLCLSFCIFS